MADGEIVVLREDGLRDFNAAMDPSEDDVSIQAEAARLYFGPLLHQP